MPPGVIVVVCVDLLVVAVVWTVAVMLVVWVAVGPHLDLLPEMFSPRGLPLELVIW